MEYRQVNEPLPGIVVEGADGEPSYALFDHGAHTVAWRPPGARPVLWVSGQSLYQADKPIRGGVPVIFPWFGAGRQGDLSPAHGFARISTWTRESVVDSLTENGTLSVTHTLPGSVAPDLLEQISVELKVTFAADQLTLEFTVGNESERPFTFEAALHTYLAVSDIRQVQVHGLEGADFSDTVVGADPALQQQVGPIRFTAETDRVYHSPATVTVRDPGWARELVVAKKGSADTVVWNPWTAKSAAMPDFGDHEWTQMLCVEAGNLGDHAISLDPGETHTLVQTLAIRPLEG